MDDSPDRSGRGGGGDGGGGIYAWNWSLHDDLYSEWSGPNDQLARLNQSSCSIWKLVSEWSRSSTIVWASVSEKMGNLRLRGAAHPARTVKLGLLGTG